MTTKQQVLALLLDSPDAAVSGEKLAHYTGVSRAAVWKAISSLREDGCVIEAATNRGYRLVGDREVISAALIAAQLRTEVFGRNCEVHAVLPSTNSRALQLASSGAREGTLVVARGQTQGRGRMGRKFDSPADAGVYMSFVLRPDVGAGLLSARCAVAVCRAIESLAEVSCGIRWVNDILISGKKVCGILCEGETELETGRINCAVAGIGINVSERQPDSAVTSLYNETGREISKNRLIAEICARMEDTDGFIAEYRQRSVLTGRTVRVTEGSSCYTARVKGIDDSCALILDTGYGDRVLRSGEIKVLEKE